MNISGIVFANSEIIMELNFPRAPKPIQKRPLWKSAAVALISLAVVFIVFFFWTHPSVGCKATGGRWYYPVDFSADWTEVGFCVYTYPDAGQPCKEHSDCKGYCMGKGDGQDGQCSLDTLSDAHINLSSGPGEWEYAP